MIRNSLLLVASFGLLAGCASSSANNQPTQNPDAGKVTYDAGGQPITDGGSAGNGATDPVDGGSATAPKGRDSTSTRAGGFKPKAVKKIASAKPPKAEPAPVDPKAKPGRVPRVDPNGLLVEAFTIPAATDKLPDFAALTLGSIFATGPVDGNPTTPLTGAPATLKAPTALRFTGTLNVTTANEYLLCTKSSDGSALFIEDTPVVDNDGIHAEAVQVCELVSLEPGEYKLEVRSFHVTGPVFVQLLWAVGKDGTPATISKTSLFKPADADARVKAKK